MTTVEKPQFHITCHPFGFDDEDEEEEQALPSIEPERKSCYQIEDPALPPNSRKRMYQSELPPSDVLNSSDSEERKEENVDPWKWQQGQNDFYVVCIPQHIPMVETPFWRMEMASPMCDPNY